MFKELGGFEPITPEAWVRRMAQAEEFQSLDVDCAMCGGSGGWPGTPSGAFVLCRLCQGTGNLDAQVGEPLIEQPSITGNSVEQWNALHDRIGSFADDHTTL